MSAWRIVSVRAGRAREHARPAWDRAPGSHWRSAYLKDEVPGPVRVGARGLEGDEQADTSVHGGPDQALLAYASAHYEAWRGELGLPGMGPGGFGENLVIEGLDETTACIGDVCEAGGARLQVSQPRGPCMNIARRWDREDLLRRVERTGRTGWYLRVLRPGLLAAGAELALVERPHPAWSVARVLALRSGPSRDPGGVRWLARCPELSARWRERFARQVEDAG